MAEPEAKEAGFVIDGVEYLIPTLDTFDMDESMLLYDYSGLTLEDFAGTEDDDEDVIAERVRKMKHPGFIKALMQIAYKRGNAGVSDTRARAVIGKSNYLEALESLIKAEEGDASPPDPSEPTRSSDESSLDSQQSSGNGSITSSDEQAVLPAPTGTTESDTSSISVQEISAA